MQTLRQAATPARFRPVRPSALLGAGPVRVQTPADMAGLLGAASPGDAASYARAMHERSCAGCDEDRVEFWAAVLECLTAGPVRSAAAPSTFP